MFDHFVFWKIDVVVFDHFVICSKLKHMCSSDVCLKLIHFRTCEDDFGFSIYCF